MEQRKNERVGLVLTATEKAVLRSLADADGGLSQAAMLRRLVRVEAEKRGLWPVQDSLQVQAEVRA